jgi:uncharacterized protein YqgC (DUF456 family)
VWLNALVAVACAIGIVGTVVPVLPGALLCAGAILVWGVAEGGHAWWFTAIALLIVAIGAVLKYLIPGRHLKAGGVPSWVILIGGIAGIVGFFLIPVVGIFVGFVGGIYLAELIRLKSVADAWPTTVAAMKAAGISALIDLASAVFATAVWVAGVVALAVTT